MPGEERAGFTIFLQIAILSDLLDMWCLSTHRTARSLTLLRGRGSRGTQHARAWRRRWRGARDQVEADKPELTNAISYGAAVVSFDEVGRRGKAGWRWVPARSSRKEEGRSVMRSATAPLHRRPLPGGGYERRGRKEREELELTYGAHLLCHLKPATILLGWKLT